PVSTVSSMPYCSASARASVCRETYPSSTSVSPRRPPLSAWAASASSSRSSVRRPLSTSSRPSGRQEISGASTASLSAADRDESSPALRQEETRRSYASFRATYRGDDRRGSDAGDHAAPKHGGCGARADQVPRGPDRLPLAVARRLDDGLRVPEGMARRA